MLPNNSASAMFWTAGRNVPAPCTRQRVMTDGSASSTVNT